MYKMENNMRRGKKDCVPISLEVPPTLKQRLAGVAEEERRSLNAEIVLRLERSFESEQRYNGF